MKQPKPFVNFLTMHIITKDYEIINAIRVFTSKDFRVKILTNFSFLVIM